MRRQFLKFALIGGSATGIQYLILVLLTELAGINPVVSSTLGFMVSVAFNYLGNYYFTFTSAVPHRSAAPKFLVIASVGLVINALVMSILTEATAVPYLAAQVLATGAVMFWNFFLNRHWTYGATNLSAMKGP